MLAVDLNGYDPEQVKLMEEMCIVIDENDKAIGADTKKNCHLMTNINAGLLHRAFSVFLFNKDKKLLLQQRADEKITFPGYWTNTCCSHPLMRPDEIVENNAEGAKVAARRKLGHELGIKSENVDLDSLTYLTRIHYLAPSDGTWGEHEIDYIFFLKYDHDVHFVPNANEVKDTKWVNQQELRQLFDESARNPKQLKITPWFRLICENFLFKWWDKLVEGRLDECVESEKIWTL
ncbi:NUDIX hydrolase domain-like protein [Paraphysoderma sedebokerense]|nr:NUDIX hydrolase domain-like protein [Paraphysoderma sedebokerense]KAI9137196.1 NUDIX hydrolase domain-like protein [Paraphysoderma sedebokerense]